MTKHMDHRAAVVAQIMTRRQRKARRLQVERLGRN